MQNLFFTYLFILWTLFWSFSSVIIYRLKNKKSGIISGRSECPKCKHKLLVIDLIPIFSYISTLWKCRYCKEKISKIYPILEITTWILFILVWVFLVDSFLILSWNLVEIYKLWFFLFFSFLSIIYVFYDILYFEIPDSILISLIWLSFFTISLQSMIWNFHIIKILPEFNNYLTQNEIIFLIIFWIIMIWSFYFIMMKWLKEIWDILIIFLVWFFLVFIKFYLKIDLEQSAIWSAILWSYFLFLFLFLQILVSGWSWVWGGDLRIVILMWLISWINFSFYSIMSAYLLWSIVWLIIIFYSKMSAYYKLQKNFLYKIKKILWIKKTYISLDTKIAFWPFLALWIYIVLFFNNFLVDLFSNYL